MPLLTTLSVCFALMFQSVAGEAPPKPDPNKVLATVGGSPIKAADLERYLWDWRTSEVLSDLVSFNTVAVYAKKEGVTVSDTEVLAELERQIKEATANLPPGANMDEEMRKQGFPKSRLWLRIKTQLLVDRLVLRKLDPSEFVKISTIVVRKKGDDPDSVAEAAKQAKNLYDRLKGGLEWKKALSEVTQEPQILQSEGSIGWKLISAFSTSTGAEIKTLKAGGFTKPSLTTNGFQIFRIDLLGRDAKGEEMDQLRRAFALSERAPLLRKIQDEVQVEYPK